MDKISKIKTDYYRLKRIRDFICDNRLVNIIDDCSSAHHDRVPVPMNPALDTGENGFLQQALSIVEEIFMVEKSLVGMPEKDIYSERIKKTKPLLNKYWKLIEGTDAPIGSALYKAVNYSLNNKKRSLKGVWKTDGWS